MELCALFQSKARMTHSHWMYYFCDYYCDCDDYKCPIRDKKNCLYYEVTQMNSNTTLLITSYHVPPQVNPDMWPRSLMKWHKWRQHTKTWFTSSPVMTELNPSRFHLTHMMAPSWAWTTFFSSDILWLMLLILGVVLFVLV